MKEVSYHHFSQCFNDQLIGIASKFLFLLVPDYLLEVTQLHDLPSE